MLRPEDAVVKHSIDVEYTYTVVFGSQAAPCGLIGCSDCSGLKAT